LLRDFSARIDKGDIFKQKIGNDSLHKISSDSGARVGNFATSKDLGVRHAMFPRYNIHKVLGHILMGKPTIRLTIF
jgi:hypothetical protein